MIDKKIGLIGGGAMAEAMVKGIIASGTAAAERIYIADHKDARCAELREKYGVCAVRDARQVAAKADIMILAVKPQSFQKTAEQIKDAVRDDTIVISVIAGLSVEALETWFAVQPVLRVMPNTPVAVMEGMSAIVQGTRAEDTHVKFAEEIFGSIGKIIVIAEGAMDAVSGLSGSGPGYGFVLIDALADAGVKVGLPRKTAIMLAAQTLLGTAKMVLETGKHPAELRDMVTSPGGTTIEGIYALERHAVRAALIEAVEVSAARSKEMGRR